MAYEYKNPWGAGGKFWPPKWQDNKWVASADGARKEAEEQEESKKKTKLQTRPPWNKVFEGYPKNEAGNDDQNAVEVFTSILGENYDRDIFTNACATRVSLGLLNGGTNVEKNFLIQKGKFKGKGFIASAIGLKKWLSRSDVWGSPDNTIEGPTDLVDVQKFIGNKNGVYIILGGFSADISGHATLWIGATKNAFGGHNYISYGGTVNFWELK